MVLTLFYNNVGIINICDDCISMQLFPWNSNYFMCTCSILGKMSVGFTKQSRSIMVWNWWRIPTKQFTYCLIFCSHSVFLITHISQRTNHCGKNVLNISFKGNLKHPHLIVAGTEFTKFFSWPCIQMDFYCPVKG